MSSDSPHRSLEAKRITFAVLTVSDSRDERSDVSGRRISEMMERAGYRRRDRRIVPDEEEEIERVVRGWVGEGVDVVLITGGTGISPRDRTPEAVEALIEKPLPGFGELFRFFSYQEIGGLSLLSRAGAGISGRSLIVYMPGSPGAVTLMMEKLLLPSVGHIVYELRRERK
ncbi:MAG: molybdenum cofactor biosynthesis protein MoaB [Thermoplasmata archaeon]|nr:molybdenum cofactor biosynthesis protein MoaB [Thermoplasmata archaeon]